MKHGDCIALAFLFLILLYIILGWTLLAHADIRATRLKVTYYAAADSISLPTAIYIQHKIAGFYRNEFDTRMVVGRFRVREFDRLECLTMPAFTDFSCWNAIRADNRTHLKAGKLSLAILPPIYSDGKKLFAGYGDVGAMNSRATLAMAHCTDTRSNGKSGDTSCFLVSTHEIGHNFGLLHCDPPTSGCPEQNYMRSAPGGWVDVWGWNLPVASFSGFQFKLHN